MFNVISHATVINALKKVKALRETNYEFRKTFDRIDSKLKE